jgi:hypothetical protein
MARVCRIVLVCEGWEDVAFLKGFFTEAGIKLGIEARKNPRGRGCGFDYVREIFAQEVQLLGRYHEGRGVLAMIDEDGKGVEVRRSSVTSLLEPKDLPRLDCSQGRCLILPKRNIETWIYWLTGAKINDTWQVSETDDYKKTRPAGATRALENEDWRVAGRKLHSINHTTPPAGMPAELLVTLNNLRKFIQAVKR